MLTPLLKSPRWLKKLIFLVHDTLLLFFSFWLALGLRLNIQEEWKNIDNWQILIITIGLSLLVFIRLGLYRAVLRYAGEKTLKMITAGVLVSVLSLLVSSFFLNQDFPRSIPILYGLLVIFLMVGSRFTIKNFLQKDNRFVTPVIIYGAGDSGRQLLSSINQVDSYYPVAFIDDDSKLCGAIIHDKPVYRPQRLARLVEEHEVKTILLAIPSASQQRRKEILQDLEKLKCNILTMPGLKDLVEGKVSVNSLKKVSVLELLGREAVSPEESLMKKDIAGNVVMVTGAGGSIGSELCRQIVRQSPKTLILFELSEFSLYSIERELSGYVTQHNLDVNIIPALGSVQYKDRLSQLMTRFKVDTVYHAAAYKHVPLVEYNTIEGVQNNVFGTLSCAGAAIEAKVPTFVLISTDKAVRPTNTMGTSKRMAELVLQALAKEQSDTRFCMVRFGNVLGSSGSVIPLFEKQIAQGGPLTVTHKDITRFFMTIPEAAQLVIQAGAMGKGGDVFLLDMGEPVKIIDLAKKMVHLSGLELKDEENPDGDIAVEVTGLRPGEKLYEELLIDENADETGHPRIMGSNEKMLPWSELQPILEQLEDACLSFNAQKVREILLAAPTDFTPSDELCDILVSDAILDK